jgi:8-oxo-dGTP pyrophosphatase MutT (NUDIX family)
MKTEKGVALVVYKKPEWKPRYLVLNRKKNWEGWELAKGHLENDDYEETVRIELEEEAGITAEQIESIEEVGETVEWTFERDGEKIKREYKGFVVKVVDDAVVDTRNNPSDEHEGGHFFNFSDADVLLTYDNQKKLLETVNDRIEE